MHLQRDVSGIIHREKNNLTNKEGLAWEALSQRDREILLMQNAGKKFDISVVHAVAKRCRAGYPQVVVCLPFPYASQPFPTLLWLTCPYLMKKCGELESQRKISELEDIFKLRKSEVDKWHREYSSLRAELITRETENLIKGKSDRMWNTLMSSGAGGMDWHKAPSAVKCLHLQIAGYLGMKWHPAEDYLTAEFFTFECGQRLCDNLLPKRNG